MYKKIFNSKIGNIVIVEKNQSIIELKVIKEKNIDIIESDTPLLKKAAEQINEYFSGKRETFDLPLNPEGTEFMKKVWKQLLNIPYGETKTYKQIATEIGNEKAARAVGMANNKNPIPIIIPCHRVIGSNKKLVGYALGLDVKEKLLKLEAKYKKGVKKQCMM